MNLYWTRLLLLSLIAIGAVQAQGASPIITQQPQSQTVKQGSNVTFAVTATGTAPLGYQWLFNWTNSLDAETNSSLFLANAQGTDRGGYAVVITSPSGSVTSQLATLTVLIRPVSRSSRGI